MTKPKVPIRTDGEDRREARSSKQLDNVTDKLEQFTEAVRNSGNGQGNSN